MLNKYNVEEAHKCGDWLQVKFPFVSVLQYNVQFLSLSPNQNFCYSWLGMLMRSILAALDWNFNVRRKYKLSKSGEPLYKSKVNVLRLTNISILNIDECLD